MMNNSSERVSLGQSSNNLRPPPIDIRILVVDDDATTLAVVSSMLQICRYKVETAKNPLDALATLRLYNGHFDLVVTDLHMPFMNGFELTRQIGKEFKLPVILMSADEKENVLDESIRSGIKHYISKPVSTEDLRNLWQFVDKAKKGKSVMIDQEIGNPGSTLMRRDNLGNVNRPFQLYGGDFGGGGSSSSTGFGSLLQRSPGINKRTSNERDRNRGDENRSNKKHCTRKDGRDPLRSLRTKRPKKSKIVWTNSLHNRFLLAMRHLGYNKAVPKKILDFMNVPGLTRENVASHLQKYRMFLKRVAENGVLDATKMLTDRFMRSSFATGYPMELMLEHAQQMYPHLYRRASAAAAARHPVPIPISNPRGPAPRPVGLSTLLMDNRPSANVIQQPSLTHHYNNNNNIISNTNSNNISITNNNSSAGFMSRRFDSYNSLARNSNSNVVANANTTATIANSAGLANWGSGQVLSRFSQGMTNSLSGGFGFSNGRSNYNNLQILSSNINSNNNNNSNNNIINNNNNVISNSMVGLGQRYLSFSSPNVNLGGNVLESSATGGQSGVMGMVENFGGNVLESSATGFLNQSNQLPIPVPQNNYELRVEDYASDLTAIAMEECRDRRVISNNDNINNNQVINSSANQQSVMTSFTASQTNNQSMQVQNNDQGLFNALPFDTYFPPIDSPMITLQTQGVEQILQNNISGNALPPDTYFPLSNPIPLQSQGIEQVVQNLGGYNNAQPFGVDQVLQNSGHNDIFPSSNFFTEQNTLFQTLGNEELHQIPSVFPTDVYVPQINETNFQQGGEVVLADPFQHIDLENLQSDGVDWDDFMDSVLNDSAPDLRE